MRFSEEQKRLGGLLYELHRVREITPEVNLVDNSRMSSYLRSCAVDEIDRFLEAVSWAEKNPEYDYKLLLPRLQHDKREILGCLRRARERLLELRKQRTSTPS